MCSKHEVCVCERTYTVTKRWRNWRYSFFDIIWFLLQSSNYWQLYWLMEKSLKTRMIILYKSLYFWLKVMNIFIDFKYSTLYFCSLHAVRRQIAYLSSQWNFYAMLSPFFLTYAPRKGDILLLGKTNPYLENIFHFRP